MTDVKRVTVETPIAVGTKVEPLYRYGNQTSGKS